MSTKTTKIVNYVTTGIISLWALLAAFSYITNPGIIKSFGHLGFPDYFRIELAAAKFIGAILLWLPFRILKEAAYTGYVITFASAFIAHIAMNDGLVETIAPVFALAVLFVSFLTYRKLLKAKQELN